MVFIFRCKKLIDQGENQLYLHSLGAAIPRALNLALQIQKSYGAAITLETATSTVELTGEINLTFSHSFFCLILTKVNFARSEDIITKVLTISIAWSIILGCVIMFLVP